MSLPRHADKRTAFLREKRQEDGWVRERNEGDAGRRHTKMVGDGSCLKPDAKGRGNKATVDANVTRVQYNGINAGRATAQASSNILIRIPEPKQLSNEASKLGCWMVALELEPPMNVVRLCFACSQHH